ncbi:RseA-like anti sigma(E) protein [Sphaerotilus hippei]|uniref:RseA-like anti sigma(E) protein n=1 Tax=Sphaerotilus hippei TaxID=744406 RepID=A0A318H6H3_9BURK|nr:sigma-E factor negative regulatory protein [Sphaerotilus hippei]PXW97040.1 RseA-like anti sigma(E) protein [Sphaerotilus hippei]
MNEPFLPARPADEELSALMDGEVDAQIVARACRSWRQDAGQRTSWHAYHLIGDVLRSDELSSPPSRDEAFLQALRSRLAEEPVVLAPTPPEPSTTATEAGQDSALLVEFPTRAETGSLAPTRRRSALRRWSAPLGMAAGVALVAGVVLLNRGQEGSDALFFGSSLAAAGAASMPAMDAASMDDAQLARYLTPHKQFSGVPVGQASYLRSATFQQTQPVAVGQ